MRARLIMREFCNVDPIERQTFLLHGRQPCQWTGRLECVAAQNLARLMEITRVCGWEPVSWTGMLLRLRFIVYGVALLK